MTFSSDDGYQALAERARREILAEAGTPVCPACGADGEYDVFDITIFNDRSPQFILGDAHCTAKCYRVDPERYLAAVLGT